MQVTYTPDKLWLFWLHRKNPQTQGNLSPMHRYTTKIPDPAPFWSQHGAQFGSLRVFPIIKIIVVRQVCVCGAGRSWTHLFCVCFCVCGQQKPDVMTPKLSPMAGDAITRDGIGSLVSLVYTCILWSHARIQMAQVLRSPFYICGLFQGGEGWNMITYQ